MGQDGHEQGRGNELLGRGGKAHQGAGHDDGLAAEHPAHGFLHAELRGDALEGEHHVGAVVELGVHGAGAEGTDVDRTVLLPQLLSHAVLAAQDLIDGPFAVINADDYYGPEAFKVIYEYLSTHQDGAVYDYCMVSYLLKNTVSENGTVSRGVCVVNPDGTLHSVTERTGIETYEGGIRCTSLTGEGTDDLPVEAPVSMNLWGFGKSFLDEADRRFAGWLRENLPKNPLKCEYFLPTVASELIDEGKAAVTVLKSTDKWYGVTYREDKPTVVAAIAQKTQEGLYPEDLWA